MIRKFLVLLILCEASSIYAAPLADHPVKFDRESFHIGKQSISVAVARTPEQHEFGLMFKDTMPPDDGMLFIFDHEQKLDFWMMNTFIPLDVGFFDKKGVLIDVQQMAATSKIDRGPFPTYSSKGPAQFALEMNQGWFKAKKIPLKARLSPVPTLPKSRD